MSKERLTIEINTNEVTFYENILQSTFDKSEILQKLNLNEVSHSPIVFKEKDVLILEVPTGVVLQEGQNELNRILKAGIKSGKVYVEYEFSDYDGFTKWGYKITEESVFSIREETIIEGEREVLKIPTDNLSKDELVELIKLYNTRAEEAVDLLAKKLAG